MMGQFPRGDIYWIKGKWPKFQGLKAIVQICKTSKVNPEILAMAELSGILSKLRYRLSETGPSRRGDEGFEKQKRKPL